MTKMVTIYIDDIAYEVPAGTNLVDVAKFYADNDIPVFCYHPKMEPVGMCRMCLVELGSLMKDRETGEVMLDEEGNPQIRWFPKLQTACTQIVSDGMVVRTDTEEVAEGRDDIIEFILTSHPLDCPICDKGGECPLQNLTMRHGPEVSRFYLEDKMKLAKHYPLGELIFLDRERCIQCARCTRYCDEVAGDDVLAFHERGRALQIVTNSDPPFDSYFSGNTTDICPVGALTTADFRFGARPWELRDIPSIDPYTPEGANISLSTRLDRDAGGIVVVKRVMPRQNEFVNEIWISDKVRFGHHHSRAQDRLITPLVRKDGVWGEANWQEALDLVSGKLKEASSVGAIAGPAMSNEDLWELGNLVEAAGGGELGVWPATMSGGDLIQQVGVGTGTSFSPFLRSDGTLFEGMGKETVILAVATDLEEEAPIWWLRAKQASDRGATLISLNPRYTSFEYKREEVPYVDENLRLRYDYGEAVEAMNSLVAGAIKRNLVNKDTDGYQELEAKIDTSGRLRSGYGQALEAIANAENVVIFCGGEGVSLEHHRHLMQACANLLILTGHVGRPNNGLIAVWPGANLQGAFDLGFSAEATARLIDNPPDVLIMAGCNPIGEALEATRLADAKFIVTTSMFETPTTDVADVVLPQQSTIERDGTFTNGERRVQRFYAAQGVIGESLPDWKICSQLRQLLDGSRQKISAAVVMAEISKSVENYAEMSYKKLAQIKKQFPDVGGDDLYYGGTAYINQGGIGVQYPTSTDVDGAKPSVAPVEATKLSKKGDFMIVPVTLLYDREMRFVRSTLMEQRIGPPRAMLNPADARKSKIEPGDSIAITVGDITLATMQAVVAETVPEGVILLPRRLSNTPGPFFPTTGSVEKVPETEALATI